MLNIKLKSIISTILIISMILGSVVTNFATGNDVNVTDAIYETKDPSSPVWKPIESEGFSALAGLQQPEQIGARVSLYDIETQNCLETLDFVSNYEKYKDYRRISEYPKTEIIKLNGEIDSSISDNIQEESTVTLDSKLAKVSITFPNFLNTSFAGGGGTAEHIRKHYEQDEKVKELLNEFTIKDEAWKNFKQRKVSILVEPMIAITNKINEPDSTYAFTCAEAGLMGLAGYVYRVERDTPKYSTKEEMLENVPFEKRILGYNMYTHERLYKALPYGSFKDRPEYITMIPNYTGTVGLNGAGSDYMVDRLGCFEITAATISEIATPCTIKFHPNGKYFGIDSNIDEKYTIKDINVGDEIRDIDFFRICVIIYTWAGHMTLVHQGRGSTSPFFIECI